MAPRKIECPICFFVFDGPEKLDLNDIVLCPDCGKELEVTNISPLELTKCSIDEDWGE